MLLARAADAAGVARQDLVFFHGGGKDRPEQTISLRRHRHRNAIAEQICPPFPDHWRGQLSDRHGAQIRRNVLGEMPGVEVDRPDPQTGPLSYPRCGVVSELDLPAIGVCPLPRHHLGLDEGERSFSVTFALICVGAGTHTAIRPWIADLETARFPFPNVTETSVSFPVRHNAAPLNL